MTTRKRNPYPTGTDEPTEGDIQRHIIDGIKARWPQLKPYHVPNEGQRSFHKGKQMVEEGLCPGVCDIVVQGANGLVVYIEVKRNEKEKLKPSQIEFIAKMRAINVPVLVTWQANEALKFVASQPREFFIPQERETR